MVVIVIVVMIVNGIQYSVYGIQYLVYGIQYLVFGIQYTVYTRHIYIPRFLKFLDSSIPRFLDSSNSSEPMRGPVSGGNKFKHPEPE